RAEAMDRLAHEDFMTGLANRTRCEEMFFDLGHSKGVFALISIDINYLKLTNDRYGHQEGDRLLIDFSKVMKGACENEPVTAGRMGGDEFVVIIPGLENDVDQRIVEKMDKLGEELNADRKPLPLSFSYGICRSNDAAVSGSSDIVEAVYRVADERMYEMKKNMKARREDVG
ncbi:MAG: GGDEF domain-containing protein, partial [Lachnospiraceae bacterium]|nr:GGDEF domain-containing protein [Lachnospiraceae bacterium]